jgi:hypothetical protein
MRKPWIATIALAAVLASGGGALAGDGKVKLFKVVSVKDDTIIGLTDDQLRGFGSGADVEVLSKQLAAAGQLTVWQYVTRKAADGALQQAPLRQVSIFPANTVRIEPYATPLEVVAPQ